MNHLGVERIGILSEEAFLAVGAALYAGEGAKGGNKIVFANTDPSMIAFFCAWLRRCFDIDESRLRVRVYLHEGLDLEAAHAHWSSVSGVPLASFRTGYRAPADPTIRRTKREFGCCYVAYCCTRTHRAVLGIVGALLSSEARSGVAQLAARAAVNR